MSVARLALAAAVSVALVGGLALTTGDPPPPAAITVDGPAPQVQQWKADGVYLAEVRARGVAGTEGATLGTAAEVCRMLRGGAGLDVVIAEVQRRHRVAPGDAAYVVGEAIRARCATDGFIPAPQIDSDGPNG